MEYLRMQPEHTAQVAELEKQCFSMPWSENAISGELTNPLALWLVAMDGDVLVGYIGSQSVMGEADVMNIAVNPEYRRQGVAERLISFLIDQLDANGVSSLTLEVRASNEGAVALYNKLCFEHIGRRPNYYSKPKEDALILRKEWHCENSCN